MTDSQPTSTLEGAWRTGRYVVKDVDGRWSTLYVVHGPEGAWGSAEAGTYVFDGRTLTFLHRLMFQGGGGRPLNLTQTASHTEACSIVLTAESLTIQFPSGNTLLCDRLHRG